MKRFFAILALVLGVSGFTYAQDGVVKSNGTEQLKTSKISGEYAFTFPATVTKEQVENNAKYYTLYFTPVFDDASKKVSIKLNENTERSRYVIARFLTACGMKEVAIDGKNVDMTSFIENYLK
jgi:hypothetical protein